MRGTFNIFQTTMLDWNRIYPYNAVHVVRVPRPLDSGRLSAVVDRVMEGSGLNCLVVDPQRRHYEYREGRQHYDIRVPEVCESLPESLEREIEGQLNQPFEEGEHMAPVRYFSIPDADGFYLGLAYSHFVAGADSIVQLVRGVVEEYLRPGERTPCLFRDRYPPGYGRCIALRPGTLAGWLATLPSGVRSLRRSFRPYYRDPEDQVNGLKLFRLGESSLQTLLHVSKTWGVTVNDLFMAVMLKVLSPYAAGRHQARRRRSISVASVANIRKDLGIPPEGVFGLFLGFLRVTYQVPPTEAMRETALEVHRQTAEMKARSLYLRAALELAFSRFVRDHLKPSVQRKFYAKYFPLWGGLTNVNLNSLWAGAGEAVPADYIRSVSTGPVCPVVFSVTTVGRKINGTVSYRRSAFTADDIVDMIAEFSARIEKLGVDA